MILSPRIHSPPSFKLPPRQLTHRRVSSLRVVSSRGCGNSKTELSRRNDLISNSLTQETKLADWGDPRLPSQRHPVVLPVRLLQSFAVDRRNILDRVTIQESIEILMRMEGGSGQWGERVDSTRQDRFQILYRLQRGEFRIR